MRSFAAEPHHDGSARFVVAPPTGYGDVVTVFLLEPVVAAQAAEHVVARCVDEGDAHYVEGRVDRTDPDGRWWRFDLPYASPTFSYRFELHGGAAVRYVNGEGSSSYEPTDHADFRLRHEVGAPDWARDAVLYQIFIDRFCRSTSAPEADRPLARWDDPVVTEWPASEVQFYGGDLVGIEERIDHLERLGVTALALTPFFPASGSHRYGAMAFDRVDPLLGGEVALRRLVTALRNRGMRCIGDLTLNHCGSGHEWFRTALRDPDSAEAGMFRFASHPLRYAAFHDIPGLPKFDYTAAETHERMYASHQAVARRWLREPYALDGWRVDVAGMVGRLGADDDNHAIARAFLRSVREERPDAVVFAEILPDPALDVRTGGWPGALLDAGFASPVRQWCAEGSAMSGLDLYHGLRAFAAAMPWQSLINSVGFVGSHDTSRLRSVTGDRDRAEIAQFLLATFPAIPMLYAGDELGVRGDTPDAGRVPMPWPGTGLPADLDMLARMTELLALRRETRALAYGGFRWLAASTNALAYERADGDERVLCIAGRTVHDVRVLLPAEPTSAEPLLANVPALTIENGAASCSFDDGAFFGAWRLEA